MTFKTTSFVFQKWIGWMGNQTSELDGNLSLKNVFRRAWQQHTALAKFGSTKSRSSVYCRRCDCFLSRVQNKTSTLSVNDVSVSPLPCTIILRNFNAQNASNLSKCLITFKFVAKYEKLVTETKSYVIC